MPKISSKQFKAVLVTELLILAALTIIGISLFHGICDGSLETCLNPNSPYLKANFFFLSVLRPITFSPVIMVSLIGSEHFTPLQTTLLGAISTGISSLVFFLPGLFIGTKIIKPWLKKHLPSTWEFIRSQDFKIILATRWIPIFPFDLMSLLFGVINFRTSRVLLCSFLGVIPELWLFANLGKIDSMASYRGFVQILIFSLITSIPVVIYEYLHRRSGTSLWVQCKKVYYEVFREVQINNEKEKHYLISGKQPPVLLIYGFFSSQRTLAILEKLLTLRGYEVVSYNLGGAFGTFFTRGIRETASFVDKKVKRLMNKHKVDKIYIVAHSKGGLVGLWWLLKMGGYRYCDHIITMGTPFHGSWLTYFALLTPLGFFWKDVWQMRPKSKLLKELHDAPARDNLKVYNFYSDRDGVAKGRKGIFHYAGHTVPIPMHHFAHFEFLYRREVADQISMILQEAETSRLLNEDKQRPDRRQSLNSRTTIK